MSREHSYSINISWTGNTGTGTSGYRNYLRDHENLCAGQSSDCWFIRPGISRRQDALQSGGVISCHTLGLSYALVLTSLRRGRNRCRRIPGRR